MTEPTEGRRPRQPRPGEGGKGARPPGPRDAESDPDVTRATGPARGHASPPARAGQHLGVSPNDAHGTPTLPPAEDDPLALPTGALVAMRRSGGLLFSSRTIVVYPDGRLATSALGGGHPARAGATRSLSAAQLARLRQILGGIDFARLRTMPSGHPRPDAYAYELAAPVGRATASLEVFEGAVPPTLAPLLGLLNGLLADDD